MSDADPIAACLNQIREWHEQDWWWDLPDEERYYAPFIARLNLDVKQLTQMLALMATPGVLRNVGVDHEIADAILLVLIDDPELSAQFEAISKWYG